MRVCLTAHDSDHDGRMRWPNAGGRKLTRAGLLPRAHMGPKLFLVKMFKDLTPETSVYCYGKGPTALTTKTPAMPRTLCLSFSFFRFLRERQTALRQDGNILPLPAISNEMGGD
jgi:hypothetical protein